MSKPSGRPESAAWAFSVGCPFVAVPNDMAALLAAARGQQHKLRDLRGG